MRMDGNIIHMLAVVIIYVLFIRNNISNKYWGMRLGFLYAVAVAVPAYYNTLILNENIII